jgi:hypothetical protein
VGFWAAPDTLKDLDVLRDPNDFGSPPWASVRPGGQQSVNLSGSVRAGSG